jgi:hypothetical protein
LAIQQYELAYQVSPLYLTGGIAQAAPGSILPFINYVTNGGIFAPSGVYSQSLLTGTLSNPALPTNLPVIDLGSLDDFFGAFSVLPGGSLINNTVAKYPFANSYVAANAIIREPLQISLMWDTPMRGANAWNTKLMTMSAIKTTLDSHVNAGGTFTVATPAYIYTNLLLTGIVDNSRGTSPLPQNAWRFDFERPLVVFAELMQALSNLNLLLGKLNGGLYTSGARSGIPPAIGAGPTQVQANPGPNTPLPSTSTPGQVSGIPSNVPLLL